MSLRCALPCLALVPGCASSLREKVPPFPPGTPREAPWGLNRELLTPANQRILIVVDVAEGHPPVRQALDDLAQLATRYGERRASWIALGQPGAPQVRWKGYGLERLAPLDPGTSYVFVRYVGDRLPKWGLSYTLGVDGRLVYVILINQERHRRWRAFIPERRLEQQTLVHEYGHCLGLPTFDHGYYVHYPDFTDGAHCVNPDCALSKPRPRAALYNMFHIIFGRHYLEDYCAACRRAIEQAKQRWRTLVDRSPSTFGPRPLAWNDGEPTRSGRRGRRRVVSGERSALVQSTTRG